MNVTEDDVAYVIELWTGIPSSKIKEDELAKLSKIEDKLKSKIIGQDEAVEAVASAIKRSRVQISPRRRPASFILLAQQEWGKQNLLKFYPKNCLIARKLLSDLICLNLWKNILCQEL